MENDRQNYSGKKYSQGIVLGPDDEPYQRPEGAFKKWWRRSSPVKKIMIAVFTGIVAVAGGINVIISAWEKVKPYFDKPVPVPPIVRLPKINLFSSDTYANGETLTFYVGNPQQPTRSSFNNSGTSFVDGAGFLQGTFKIYGMGSNLLVDFLPFLPKANSGKSIPRIIANEMNGTWGWGHYDCNQDSNAFEIVNSERVPMLQISREFHGTYRFDGWFLNGNKLIDPNGNEIYPTNWEVMRETAEKGLTTKRLFVYPGNANIGERAK